jgi:hypothetical protein
MKMTDTVQLMNFVLQNMAQLLVKNQGNRLTNEMINGLVNAMRQAFFEAGLVEQKPVEKEPQS